MTNKNSKITKFNAQFFLARKKIQEYQNIYFSINKSILIQTIWLCFNFLQYNALWTDIIAIFSTEH